MKLFSILMAIVVMSLSVRPCCDAADNKKTAEQASACCDSDNCSDSNTGKQCPDDGSCKSPCSPFFTCGSCTGTTMQDVHFDLSASAPLIFKPAPLFYDEQFHSEYFNTKWQPPKIA